MTKEEMEKAKIYDFETGQQTADTGAPKKLTAPKGQLKIAPKLPKSKTAKPSMRPTRISPSPKIAKEEIKTEEPKKLEAEKPKKPKTPQVAALPGMTPLGIKPNKEAKGK